MLGPRAANCDADHGLGSVRGKLGSGCSGRGPQIGMPTTAWDPCAGVGIGMLGPRAARWDADHGLGSVRVKLGSAR